jgi:hypothetical protein
LLSLYSAVLAHITKSVVGVAETSLANSSIVLTKQKEEVLTNQHPKNKHAEPMHKLMDLGRNSSEPAGYL